MSLIIEIISYPFMMRALVVGILVSLCASLLGVNLVLRRYSMIGDGLSHVGFGALAISAALNTAPLLITIPVVVIAAFFILRITENTKVKGDTIIAVISTSSLATGVMILSLTPGMNTDLNNYLFGSILSTNNNDMILSVIISIIVLVLFIVFYNRIFSVTFDENFSRATGIKADLYNMLIAVLTAVTIVIGMRLMGSMLISSLIIFPSLISMRVFRTFKAVTISSAIFSVVCFVIGLFISYILETPTGASIVIVNVIVLLIFTLISKIRCLN